ncbi:hypothetical protein F0Z19_3526 [Vibrio cyclitrophicus]|nr:hypothetical protein F0Z19_3526 [Vibrio cyclitrophicus]
MSFLTGIIGKTIWEILKGLFFQITWKVVLERFASRAIIWGLEALRDLSTNDVIQETVDDVVASLQGKRLKDIPQKE